MNPCDSGCNSNQNLVFFNTGINSIVGSSATMHIVCEVAVSPSPPPLSPPPAPPLVPSDDELTGYDACLEANRLLSREDCRAAAEAAGNVFEDLDELGTANTLMPTGCSILRNIVVLKYAYQSHTEGDSAHSAFCQPASYPETTLHTVCLCAAAPPPMLPPPTPPPPLSPRIGPFVTPSTGGPNGDGNYNWEQAQAYCVSVGGTLASIRNAQEQAEVLAVIAADPSGFKNAWLGGYRVDAEDGSKGPYFWATEQSFGVQFTRSGSDGTHASYPALDVAAPPDGYAQWADTQPNLNGLTTCVDIQADAASRAPAGNLGGWRSRPCTQTKRAVCMGVESPPPTPPPPTPPPPSPPPPAFDCNLLASRTNAKAVLGKFCYELEKAFYTCDNYFTTPNSNKAKARLCTDDPDSDKCMSGDFTTCEIQAPSPPASPSPPPTPLQPSEDEDFTIINAGTDEGTGWSNASAACQARGGHLIVVPNHAIHDRVQARLAAAGITSAWIGGKTDFEDPGRNTFSWYVEGYTDTSPRIPIPLVNSEAEADFARWASEGYPYTPISATNAEGETFFVHRCVDFRTDAVPHQGVNANPSGPIGGWRYRECSQKKPAVCAGVVPGSDDPGIDAPSPPPAGQACAYAIAMCKVGLATSKHQRGCSIYGYGLRAGSFVCESNAQSCTSTSRAYARLDATECELACDDHYDDTCNVPSDCHLYRAQCKEGCTRAQLPDFDMDTVCAGPDGIGGDSWAPSPPPRAPPASPPFTVQVQALGVLCADVGLETFSNRDECTAAGTTSPNPSSGVLNGFSELDLDTGDRSYNWDETNNAGVIDMPEGCFYVISADGSVETILMYHDSAPFADMSFWGTTLRAICKAEGSWPPPSTSPSPPPTPPTPPPPSPPPLAPKIGYSILPEAVDGSWQEGRDFCEGYCTNFPGNCPAGASYRLATIHSQVENDALMQVAIDNNEQYVWTAGTVKPNGGATAGYPSSKSGGRRFWWYHGSIGGVDRYEPISFNLATDPLPGYYGSSTAWPQGMPWDPEPGAGSTVDTGWALRFKASADSWLGGAPLGTWRSRNKAGTNDKYKPVCEGVQTMPTPPTVDDPPPPASPSPPPPHMPMEDNLCGGHPDSLFGSGTNEGYFAVGAPNTVSVEFCREMARLFDAGDSGGTVFGVAPDYLLGLQESQNPAYHVCGGTNEADCPPNTQGLCRIAHKDLLSTLTGNAVFFMTGPDLLPTATAEDRAAYARLYCINAPSVPEYYSYYGCFCDMRTTPPFPPSPPLPAPPPTPPLPPPSPLLPTYGYYLQPNNGAWGATTQQCRDTGGRPAMPRSMAEHTAIQQFLVAEGVESAYLGGKRDVEMTDGNLYYRWYTENPDLQLVFSGPGTHWSDFAAIDDDGPTFAQWTDKQASPGVTMDQPSTASAQARCVTFNRDDFSRAPLGSAGGWRSVGCTAVLPVVCEGVAPPAPPPSAPQQCFNQVLTTAGPQWHRQCRSEAPYLQTEITTLEDCYAAWEYFNDNDIHLSTATAPPKTPFRINLGFMSSAEETAALAFVAAQGGNAATSDLSATNENYHNWPAGCAWQGLTGPASRHNRMWWWPNDGQAQPNDGAISWDAYYICKIPCPTTPDEDDAGADFSFPPSPPPSAPLPPPYEIAPVGSSCPDLGRAHPSSQADCSAAAQYLISQGAVLSDNTASLNTNPNGAPCQLWSSFGLYYSPDDVNPNYDKASTSSVTVICAAPYAPPPSPSPAPPVSPASCDVSGMTNTRDLDPPRWCGDLNNQKTGGCGAYYSMGASGQVRFCYNPTEPVINNGQKCAPTEGVFCPPSAPPSPPPLLSPFPPPSTSPSPPPSASPSPPPSTSPSPPPSASPSPPPSPLLPSGPYWLGQTVGAFGAATEYCIDAGGRAAIIRTPEQHEAVRAMLAAEPTVTSGAYLAGKRDMVADENGMYSYRWIKTENPDLKLTFAGPGISYNQFPAVDTPGDTFAQWTDPAASPHPLNEPNMVTNARCVAFYPEDTSLTGRAGGWRSRGCDQPKPAVCESVANPVADSPAPPEPSPPPPSPPRAFQCHELIGLTNIKARSDKFCFDEVDDGNCETKFSHASANREKLRKCVTNDGSGTPGYCSNLGPEFCYEQGCESAYTAAECEALALASGATWGANFMLDGSPVIFDPLQDSFTNAPGCYSTNYDNTDAAHLGLGVVFFFNQKTTTDVLCGAQPELIQCYCKTAPSPPPPPQGRAAAPSPPAVPQAVCGDDAYARGGSTHFTCQQFGMYTTALAHCQSVVDGGGDCFVRETNRAATGCVPRLIGSAGQGFQPGFQPQETQLYTADAATCEDAGLRTATEWECETVTGTLHANYLGLGHDSNQGPYVGVWSSPTGYPYATDSMPTGCVPTTKSDDAFYLNNWWVGYNAETTNVPCNGDGLISSFSGYGGYAGCVCCDYAPVGDWEACTC